MNCSDSSGRYRSVVVDVSVGRGIEVEVLPQLNSLRRWLIPCSVTGALGQAARLSGAYAPHEAPLVAASRLHSLRPAIGHTALQLPRISFYFFSKPMTLLLHFIPAHALRRIRHIGLRLVLVTTDRQLECANCWDRAQNIKALPDLKILGEHRMF